MGRIIYKGSGVVSEEKQKDFDEYIEDVLRGSCGGLCLDSDSCECFGMPPKEVLLEIDETEETYEPFYNKEDCAHYEAVAFDAMYSIGETRLQKEGMAKKNG